MPEQRDEMTGAAVVDPIEGIQTYEDNSDRLPVVKAHVFGGSSEVVASGTKSKQKGEDPFSLHAKDRYVEPPYPPATWVGLMEKSSRLAQCVSIMVANTVGLGWAVKPIDEVDQDTPDEIKEEIKRQTILLKPIFTRCNNKMSFTEIVSLVKMDEKATGNGYLEVTRDQFSHINGFFWASSKSIRRLIKGGYVQVREYGQKVAFFKEFGDPKVIDSRTGEEFTSKDTDTDKEEFAASEIIHFKTATVQNGIYGIPPHSSATPAILGNHLVDRRNVAVFENEAVPKFAILVEGGVLSKESCDSIEAFWNAKTKGVGKTGRTIVLQAEMKRVAINRESNVRIKLEPLTVGITEDASYQKYKDANNNEIRECFGISEVFFNARAANRSAGDIGRQITNEQVFEPETKRTEHQLWTTVVTDVIGREFEIGLDEAQAEGDELIQQEKKTNGSFVTKYSERTKNPIEAFINKMCSYGVRFVRKQEEELVFQTEPLVRLAFIRSTVQDLVNQATVDEKYGKLGALTPNDLRYRLTGREYPKTPEFEWANVPLPVAVVLANRGQTPGGIGGGAGGGQGDADDDSAKIAEPVIKALVDLREVFRCQDN